MVRRFRTYYISKSPSISVVVGQEAICESPIVRTYRKGLAGFQGWNDRIVNTPAKQRCVTKRQENRTQKIEDRVERSREAFTFEHESLRGCRRCPPRKWKQISRPRKSSHRRVSLRWGSGLSGHRLCKICSDLNLRTSYSKNTP